MSNNLDIPILKRSAFFEGQRLTAADLKSIQDYGRELRHLHSRGLHGWGIVFGYAVSGLRGERLVQVQPGYALDCLGRDLILSESQSLTIPAVAGDENGNPVIYYLTASYAPDETLTPETRAGACDTNGAVRFPEQPELSWQEPGDHKQGEEVILAAIQVQNCQLAADVSTAERRSAIPTQQPYIAAGQTSLGETVWRLWPDAETPAGVATTVLTNQAGFRSRPRYQAHVVGSRSFQIGERLLAVVDGYTHIANPTSTAFDLRLILPQGAAGVFSLNPADPVLRTEFMERLQSNWYVVWMGVEG